MVVTLDKVCKDVRISLLLVCCYCFFEGGGLSIWYFVCVVWVELCSMCV